MSEQNKTLPAPWRRQINGRDTDARSAIAIAERNYQESYERFCRRAAEQAAAKAKEPQ